MKSLIGLFFIGITFCSSHTINAQDMAFINVQGVASQSVTPDEILWQLSVRNEAKETEVVAAEHLKTVGNVVAYLKKQGIDESAIQMTHMQLSENKKYERKSWSKDGYFALTNIKFKLSDLGKYVKIWTGLSAISEVSLNGFAFQYSKSNEVLQELQLKSLVDAREKAKRMAGVLDVTIGSPIEIHEHSAPVGPVHFYAAEKARFDAGGMQNLSVGTIELKANVTVKFELIVK